MKVKTTIETKEEMTRQEYCDKRGWTVAEGEDPDKLGYYLVYANGYETWMEADAFDDMFVVTPDTEGDSEGPVTPPDVANNFPFEELGWYSHSQGMEHVAVMNVVGGCVIRTTAMLDGQATEALCYVPGNCIDLETRTLKGCKTLK